MIKILFMCINMNVGGTEKALITMLNELDSSKYDVTLLMLEEYGQFLNEIPRYIKVKYVKEYKEIKPFINEPPQVLVKNLINNKKYIKGFNTLFMYSISKISKDISHYYRYLLKNTSEIEEQYDLAVAYAGPMDFITYFILNKIKANKRVQWIHFDITKIGFNKKFAEKNYKKFDKIFVVSEEGKNKLCELIPSIKYKTEVFKNIISSKIVNSMASNSIGFDDKFEGIRILTVGRLSFEKGQDIILPVLIKLNEDEYNVKWYCIGNGALKADIERDIEKHNINDKYIILGTTTNPYPFMKECDIYVQTSRHEGYCITLAEARCFNNPIVTTNFTGASEQIKNYKTGLIVNFDVDEIYAAIKELLDNNSLKEEIKSNLINESIDTSSEIEKINNLFN